MLSADGAHFESELEINDFPQQARWKVTHKDTLAQISEFTGARRLLSRGSITPRTSPCHRVSGSCSC